MLSIRYPLAALLLAITVINGPACAQGTPQTITAKQIDVVEMTTGYRASKIRGLPCTTTTRTRSEQSTI